MALALPPFPFMLSLFLLVCCCYSRVNGDDQGFGVLELSTLKPANMCSEWKAPSKNSLRIVRRFSPCSASNDGLLTDTQILAQDSLRVAYLHNRINRTANAKENTDMDPLQTSLEITLPARDGEFLDTYDLYVVTIGIGTPKRDQTIIFDTGSNLCWLQCEPCRSCYHQAEPIFNSTASPTYRNVPCNHQACTRLPASNVERGCTNNICTYDAVYMDLSTTSGLLAIERLELSASQMHSIVLPDFVFGCGKSNGGGFGRVAGLFGLGRGFHSLVTQASSRLGNAFSYCLPSMLHVPGYLVIGRRAAPSPMYTPMRIDPRHSDRGLYFVDLLGISVSRQRLQLPQTVFQNVGTVIDSGTVITCLPPVAYRVLRDVFRNGMSRYPPAPPRGALDTCFTIHGSNVTYPPVMLHFTGVNLPLKGSQILYSLNPTVYCLAFAPSENGTASIIGNTQQMGMEVIYDIDARRIGFSGGTNCI